MSDVNKKVPQNVPTAQRNKWYEYFVAHELMNDLERAITGFESDHHLDTILDFEPEIWFYVPPMTYQDVSDLLKDFFVSHYPALFRNELDRKCLNVFDQTAEECLGENIIEFRNKIIETTRKFLDDNVAPIVDKLWAKVAEAMTKVQKYFYGLTMKTYDVEYKSDYVKVIYFVKNGELFYAGFNPKELIQAYHVADEFYNRIAWNGNNDIDTSDLFHCTDDFYNPIEELIPEDLRDDINPGDYAIVQHSSECNFGHIMCVFLDFDKKDYIRFD